MWEINYLLLCKEEPFSSKLKLEIKGDKAQAHFDLGL